MATIEILPEEIFSEENKYLKIPDSVLNELKKYAPKNFNSINLSNEKVPKLNGSVISITLNMVLGVCFISNMLDSVLINTENFSKKEEFFFGVEKIIFEIHEKKIKKILLEMGSVDLNNEILNNCLINLYKSYEKNRKETLEILKNKSNLVNHFNKENIHEKIEKNPNVIDFVKGSSEKKVVLEDFMLIDKDYEVIYNLKDISSNILSIEYKNKKPVINNIEVFKIDFRSDGNDFFINKISGCYRHVKFDAWCGFDGKVSVNPSNKIIYFKNENLNLNNSTYNCGAVFIYYKKNIWPFKVSGFRFDTLSPLGFLNKEDNNTIKDINEAIKIKKNKFKNLSKESSLFFCFMLHENEKKVLEALKDIGIDDDISKITENEFYLLEMNNNWFLEVKKIFTELVWLAEKYLEVSEYYEEHLGFKKHLKSLSSAIKKKKFKLGIMNFLVIDPRRPLF